LPLTNLLHFLLHQMDQTADFQVVLDLKNKITFNIKLLHTCVMLESFLLVRCIVVWFRSMVFSALSTIFQLYRGGQFNWRRKSEYLEKTQTCHKSRSEQQQQAEEALYIL
jgi:hypothetical protein